MFWMIFGAHIEVSVIEWEQVEVVKNETVELPIGKSGRSVDFRVSGIL